MSSRISLRRSILIACAAIAGLMPERADAACQAPDGTSTRDLSIGRTVTIDTSQGHVYGSMTRLAHERTFLKPKEVVLTFDDGPMPWVTKSILDTLDSFCTKATFFAVGRMALAYPKTVADVLNRGHTLASHTYSHPYNMPRMKPDAAKAEIERGLAAIASVAGRPIAPFFRFPALADNQALVTYLKSRNIATFTVDVVTNDSYIHAPKQLTEATLAEVEKHQGGIILLHDIKLATAKALPDILAGLQARGYSVVHVVAKAPAVPLMASLKQPESKVAKVARTGDGRHIVVPFYGSIVPDPDTRPDTSKSSVANASFIELPGQRLYGWATTAGHQAVAKRAKTGTVSQAKPSTGDWTARLKTSQKRNLKPSAAP